MSNKPSGNPARFIGAWQLISQISRHADGTVFYPRGEKAHGLLMYDRSGMMSAQLMRPDHQDLSNDLDTALTVYLAYYGTYTVDEVARTVTHHVKDCSYNGWENTDQVRTFVFEGDRLTLTAPSPRPGEGDRVIVWQRLGKSSEEE